MPTTTTTTTSSSSRMMPSLPAGFRFHPTDEELIVHYLTNQAASLPCPVPIIAEVNIYRCNPWDLPRQAAFLRDQNNANEWYFFSPRDRKYPNGARPNRAAGDGYWKATGTDKPIILSSTSRSVVGVKKALVFYRGKPPKGVKTDWIMHEYRLTATAGSNNNTRTTATKRKGSSSSSMRLDDWVLCRIHKKSNGFRFSDQDQEGSTVENDAAPSSKSEETVHATDDHQFPPLSMTKSCSLTNLLNTFDYSTLSQLLLDAPPAEAELQHQSGPLIYTTPACHQPLNVHDSNVINMPQDDVFCSDYGTSCYNAPKRKRIMSSDDGASSFDDGGSSLKKKLHVPRDSRSSPFFGSTSGSCQEIEEPSSGSSFQYSSLLMSHPFLYQ